MAEKKKEVMQLSGLGLATKKKKLKKSVIDAKTVEEGISKMHPENKRPRIQDELEEPTVRISGKFKKSVYLAMKKKILERGESVTDYIDRLVRKDLGI